MSGESCSISFNLFDATDAEIRSWVELEVASDEFKTQLETHGILDIDEVRRETVELCSQSWADNEEDETEASEAVEPVGVNLNRLGFSLARVKGEDDYEPFPLSRNHLFRVACAIAIKNDFARAMHDLVTEVEPGFQILGYVDYKKNLGVKLQLVVDPINMLVNVVPTITIEHRQSQMLRARLEEFAKDFLLYHGIQFEKGYLTTRDIERVFGSV